MFDNKYVRITNNFLHDMATGTWAACLMVLVILSGRLAGMPDVAAAALGDAMTLVFWLLVGALVVVCATGGIRVAYWRREAAPDAIAETRRALIVKHIVFALVYGTGTFWAWQLLP